MRGYSHVIHRYDKYDKGVKGGCVGRQNEDKRQCASKSGEMEEEKKVFQDTDV